MLTYSQNKNFSVTYFQQEIAPKGTATQAKANLTEFCRKTGKLHFSLFIFFRFLGVELNL